MARVVKKWQADAVAWLHFSWILFGAVTSPLVFVISWWDMLLLGYVVVTVGHWYIFRGCILTIYERRIRKQCDPENVYEGSFIRHYSEKYLGIRLSRTGMRVLLYSYMALLLLVAASQLL